MFVDRAKIKVSAGNGGRGCLSFRREKFVNKGGPDGGSGGDGGDVVLICDVNLSTLLDFQYKSRYNADSGSHGKGKNKDGKKGEDLFIKVPPGTVVKLLPGGEEKADLVKGGETFLSAKGGKGGRGNTCFKSSVNRAPRTFEEGSEGEQAEFLLELKLIAAVGLIGCPNAGKSSLLSRISNADPKIADYPFTTTGPKVGVVKMPSFAFKVAEVPGLIKDAHKGKGLGDQFLRHIERTKYIVHVVDLASDAANDFRIVSEELSAHGHIVPEEKHFVAANKVDLPGALANLESLRKEIGNRKMFQISCVTGSGIEELIEYLSRLVKKDGVDSHE